MRRMTMLTVLVPVAAFVTSGAAPLTRTTDAARAPTIRAHFDSVLVELRARDVSALSADQRERRGELVEVLRRYKDRGAFPHNYDFPGQAVPYFVDRKTGTRCAVAQLLFATGRGDIVARVARTNNNVRAIELKGDAPFEAWLDENGLTLEEAARIQPSYDWEDGKPKQPTAAYWAIAGATSVGLVNLASNSDGHSRIGNWLGAATGVTSMIVGVVTVRDLPSAGMPAGFVSAGVGALAVGCASSLIVRHHRVEQTRKEAERTRVAVAPILPTRESGVGLSLSLRF